MLTSFEVIPDHIITKHLGLINLFIIRETTALYEVRPSFIALWCHYCQPLTPLSHCWSCQPPVTVTACWHVTWFTLSLHWHLSLLSLLTTMFVNAITK